MGNYKILQSYIAKYEGWKKKHSLPTKNCNFFGESMFYNFLFCLGLLHKKTQVYCWWGKKKMKLDNFMNQALGSISEVSIREYNP